MNLSQSNIPTSLATKSCVRRLTTLFLLATQELARIAANIAERDRLAAGSPPSSWDEQRSSENSTRTNMSPDTERTEGHSVSLSKSMDVTYAWALLSAWACCIVHFVPIFHFHMIRLLSNIYFLTDSIDYLCFFYCRLGHITFYFAVAIWLLTCTIWDIRYFHIKLTFRVKSYFKGGVPRPSLLCFILN